MLQLHPQEVQQNGVELVQLPKTEFETLQQMAEDYQDLFDLEEAIEKNAGDPGMPYDESRKTLKLDA